MTDLTPGPDLDRRVAEAVGWEIVTMGFRYPVVFDAAAIEYRTPSLDECDALAALEATEGASVLCERHGFGDLEPMRREVARLTDLCESQQRRIDDLRGILAEREGQLRELRDRDPT